MSSSNGAAIPGALTNEVEVMVKTTRRRFSAEYKLGILREAEACTQPGETGGSALSGGVVLLEPADLGSAAAGR
jgi:hypothetical protein